MTRYCSHDLCGKPLYARGLCHQHWQSLRERIGTEWDAYQPPRHGTRKRYSKGCRCDACYNRESVYRAEWRLRTGRTSTSRVLGHD